MIINDKETNELFKTYPDSFLRKEVLYIELQNAFSELNGNGTLQNHLRQSANWINVNPVSETSFYVQRKNLCPVQKYLHWNLWINGSGFMNDNEVVHVIPDISCHHVRLAGVVFFPFLNANYENEGNEVFSGPEVS